MKSNSWDTWSKNPNTEKTKLRVEKKLPTMECTKQLKKIINKIYKPKMKILDFGCASGHYYLELSKLNKDLKYTGYDATKNTCADRESIQSIHTEMEQTVTSACFPTRSDMPHEGYNYHFLGGWLTRISFVGMVVNTVVTGSPGVLHTTSLTPSLLKDPAGGNGQQCTPTEGNK